tara:strand:+ start:865 stop:1434 length:570 start_codon:yes stop_codon:yes gene_type:complete
MWFICGLGNPGKKYVNTRHNIGINVVDNLINRYNFIVKKKDESKEIFKGKFLNNSCLLCKPKTYINVSGNIIRELVNFYKIENSKILIIHDDLDLKVGKVKIKFGGSNAGHNGLLSIDKAIGRDYKRLRIGIGHPGSKELVSSYVLNKFNKNDIQQINKIINAISENFSLIFDEEGLFLSKLYNEIHKE